MIDKSRMDQYNDHLQELQEQLSAVEFYETFRAKLMDLIARGDFQGDDLQEYIRQIKKLFRPELSKYVDRVQQDCLALLDTANNLYSDLGPEVSKDAARLQALNRIHEAQIGDYEKATVKEISKAIREGIGEGKHHTEIARDIAKLGEEVAPYADTLARTQVKGYGQAVKTEKARLGDVFFYEYVGRPLRPNSHLFCRELYGRDDRIFHVNDIRQMMNGQIEPVLVYAGGFNCHHNWEPDPFFEGEGYVVSFYSADDVGRTLRLARWAGRPSMADHLKENSSLDSVDFTGITGPLRDEISLNIINLHNRYKTNLRGIGVQEYNPDYIASFNPRTKHINFNLAYFSNKNILLNEYKKNMAAGYLPKIKDNKIPQFIISHEFAHSVWAGGPPHDFQSGLLDIQRRYHDAINTTDVEILKKNFIGRQAEKNSREFMASMFACAECSNKPSPFSLEIRSLVDRHFKRED